jgi:hypothetical protein
MAARESRALKRLICCLLLSLLPGCLLGDLDTVGRSVRHGGPLGERIRANEYGGIANTSVGAYPAKPLDPARPEILWHVGFRGPTGQQVRAERYPAVLPSLASQCKAVAVQKQFTNESDGEPGWSGALPSETLLIESAAHLDDYPCVVLLAPVQVTETRIQLLAVRGGGEVLLRQNVSVPRPGTHRWDPRYLSDGAWTAIGVPGAITCGILLPVRWCFGY